MPCCSKEEVCSHEYAKKTEHAVTPEEISELARLWLAEHTVELEAVVSPLKGRPSLGPGYKGLNSLVESNPNVAFEVVLKILHSTHSDSVKAILAAGPLENLIAGFGTALIERIEQTAACDPVFRELLGGVWKGTNNASIWRRIELARGDT